MKTDDVIDHVARRMTDVSGHPGVRERVLASLDEQRTTPRWWPAVAAVGVAAAAVVAIAVRPASEVPTTTPSVRETARRPPASEATIQATVPDVPPAADRVAASSPRIRTGGSSIAAEAATAPGVGFAEEVRPLPPLPIPAAIVMEPVGWDAVTIEPLSIDLLDVGAVAIDPLESATQTGT